MKLHPRVTRAGVELVKRFEGLRPRAARLPQGGFVIGYGHTLTAREGAQVTEADATALLFFDLSRTAEAIEPLLGAPVNANQFDALSAFAFSIGPEAFAGSATLRHLNQGAHLQAAAALELWRSAELDGDPLVVDALVRRRAAEKAHFLTPPEGFAPASSPVMRPRLDGSVLAAAAAMSTHDDRVAVVTTPLDADPARLEVISRPSPLADEPRPSAALAVADALRERLDRMLLAPAANDEGEAAAPPPPPAIEPAPPPLEPDPEPEPRPKLTGEPEPEPPPVLAEEPALTEAARPLVSEPRVAPAESPPVVLAFVPPPSAEPPAVEVAPEAASPPVGPPPAGAHPAPVAHPSADELQGDLPPSPVQQVRAAWAAAAAARAPVVTFERGGRSSAWTRLARDPRLFAGIGACGLVLLLCALTGVLLHKPGGTGLSLGLVGIVGMALCAAFFLYRRFGPPEP